MKNLMNKTLGLAAILSSLAASSAQAVTIYVNDNGIVNGNGTSWANAMRYLADALAIAQPGDEIWVAAGTYRADQSTASPSGTNDREASFVIPSGVRIYGGFPTTGFASMDRRDPAANPTILTGDIGVQNSRADNTYTIVKALNVSNGTVFDGFVLKQAQRDGNYQTGVGGAMLISGGQGPLVVNCDFDSNHAFAGAGIALLDTTGTVVSHCKFRNCLSSTFRGGGIDISSSTDTIMTDCLFENNAAYYAGGLTANFNSSGSVVRCKFVNNVAANGGGVSLSGFSDFTFRECVFMKNRSQYISSGQSSFDGGAVRNWCTPSKFINCLFVSNSANGQGGAIFDGGPSSTSSTSINCTFYDNFSRDGGTVAATAGHDPVMVNAILWNNRRSGGSSVSIQGGVLASFSAMEQPPEGLPGLDPMFVDPDGLDDVIGTLDDNFQLSSASPYIDAGSQAAIPTETTLDLAGNPRTLDGDYNEVALPDFGAYEFIAPPPPFCQGDADRNGEVEFADIASVLGNFGLPGPEGDADNNGVIDFSDIASVLVNFGNSCIPS